MRSFRCLLEIHRLNNDCECSRCGKTVHRIRRFEEWVDEPGIDPNVSYMMDAWHGQYSERKYEVYRCIRCGKEISSKRTDDVR